MMQTTLATARRAAAGAFLAAAFLAACQAPRAKASDPAHFAEEGVQKALVLLDVRMDGVDPARTLRFTLKNTGREGVACNLRIEWYDDHGAVVADGAGTQLAVDLDSGESMAVEVAPAPVGCRSWRPRFSAR